MPVWVPIALILHMALPFLIIIVTQWVENKYYINSAHCFQQRGKLLT